MTVLLLAASHRPTGLPPVDPGPEPYLHLDFTAEGFDLDDLRETFNIYGEAPAGNTNWGTGSPQLRAGRYSPTAITFGAEGMVFTMDPAYDGETRYQTPEEIDAWWAAYIRHAYVPKFFDATVRTRFDDTPGHWTAPVWFGRHSNELEMDVEWFPHRPEYIRFALHCRFDGDTETTHNVGNGGGLGSHEVLLPDPDGWHTYRCTVTDDGDGGMVFRWYLDGALALQRTSVQIEDRFEKSMTEAIAGAYEGGGWTMDLSVNAGGSAVGYPTDPESLGSEMVTEYVTVYDAAA